MGVTKTADGRVEVGVGISSADNYIHGVNSGEILIQLTESGVTDESLNKLNGLKDYAVYHLSRGESIKPGGTSVFIATADGKKQIEADDFAISVTPGEGDDPDVVEFTVGGIVWNSADGWDYSHAGQGGGGSSETYPGYDLVIRANGDYQLSLASSIEVEQGAFSDAYAKVLNGNAISVKVYSWETADDDIFYYDFAVRTIRVDTYTYENEILISVFQVDNLDHEYVLSVTENGVTASST